LDEWFTRQATMLSVNQFMVDERDSDAGVEYFVEGASSFGRPATADPKFLRKGHGGGAGAGGGMRVSSLPSIKSQSGHPLILALCIDSFAHCSALVV
jgi:hypothetical protein